MSHSRAGQSSQPMAAQSNGPAIGSYLLGRKTHSPRLTAMPRLLDTGRCIAGEHDAACNAAAFTEQPQPSSLSVTVCT